MARFARIEEPLLRQTAFAIEQMAPGGTERGECGCLRHADLARGVDRLQSLAARPGEAGRRPSPVDLMLQRARQLQQRLLGDGVDGLLYLGEAEHHLQPRLRAAAIEIDFGFGDQDGVVSEADIRQARRHYGNVRGPVGWNRLLLTDEIERRLFPGRALSSTEGLRLHPDDWLEPGGDDPLVRLRKVCRYLDDDALARTYADVAARLATIARRPPHDLAPVFERALALLGREIRARDSVRPTITDIARIGCEDPQVKAWLRTPIEMSRRLLPHDLLERFLVH